MIFLGSQYISYIARWRYAAPAALVPIQPGGPAVDPGLQQPAQQFFRERFSKQPAMHALHGEPLRQVKIRNLAERLVLGITKIVEGVEAEEAHVGRVRVAIGIREVRHDDFNPS